MPSQREIARELGLAQSTVSMALRGDLRISPTTRELVAETAKRASYWPSPMIAALMNHIRQGKKVRDQGCLAILVDAADKEEWLALSPDTYGGQYRGYQEQASLRGYRTECFFLRAPGSSPEQLDQLLQARGIEGIILAPPRRRNSEPLPFRWDRYACATASYSWAYPEVDRVAMDFRHMVEAAFETLRERGVRRIGMCLPPDAVDGVDSNWKAGFLLEQDRLTAQQRIPLFVGEPGITPTRKFETWLRRWKAEVIVGLLGHEQVWLDELGIHVPKDIGLVCLNRPKDSSLSGMEENNVLIGSMVCDLVINQLTRNERGIPAQPKKILVNGLWRDGRSMG